MSGKRAVALLAIWWLPGLIAAVQLGALEPSPSMLALQRSILKRPLAVADGQLYVVAGTPAVDSAGKPLAKEPKPQILRIPLENI